MRLRTVSSLVVPLVVAANIAGCALEKRTIGDLPPTFLTDVNLKSHRKNLPFEHSWVKPGVTKAMYKTVYFKPVRTDLLDPGQWVNSASPLILSQEDYMAKAREVADYFYQQLLVEMQTEQDTKTGAQLRLTNNPGPSTLVVEIALTEIEFSHPVARAGSLAVPVPGTGAALGSVTDPFVSFAARLTDGATGELVGSVADRKFAPMRILDLNKFTISSSNREIVSLWAKSIAQGLQGNRFTDVSETRWSILPW